MSSIQKRPDGKWRARYRDPSGRERSKHFRRRVDAQRFLATVQADVLRGTYVDPGDQTTVVEYARRWASSRPHAKLTAERTESMIRNHIEGTAIGGRRLAGLLPSDVQAWVTDRARVLAPSSLRATVKLLRSILNAAVLDRLIASSPAVRLSLPANARERVVPLTVEQVAALAEVIGPQYRAMVIVQAALGLRVGELLGLRVQDVDFLRRVVRVEHQAARRTLVLVDPKTTTSRRTIPLPQVAADAIAAHLARWPASVPVRCSCSLAEHANAPTSGLVFHTATGRPHAHEHYGTRVFGRGSTRATEQARQRCKACDAEGWALDGRQRATPAQRCRHSAELPPGTTTHDLRHHYASVLLAARESVVDVAERLGHDDATLVLTTYGHLMPNSEDRTRKAIDAAWTRTRRPASTQDADQGRTDDA